ncbi:hypothetical protein B0H66DRAFT_563779 [Apodospora peruviana]|uniref:Rhodopsin domain-containing protein n=1 Tax=Apodospora peruviana TaxID=516989 RepID=A0AAE0HXN4_9PEZI|nr:hypothetical protein B0H66DRAFT_563779 [Apodospora peruviana]
MVQLDHFDVQQKRQFVMASVVIGVLLSTISVVCRVWARLLVIKKLRREDWFMIAGLALSYGTVACMVYGLSITQTEDLDHLTPAEQREFRINVWIVQKLQPPTIFCIKTSIILFNASIFQTRKFRIVSWIVWGTTFAWMIATFFATTFQCSPPSFFWDKNQDGRCLANTLRSIALPSAIISCLGDFVIFLMPIPALSKLKIDKRTRIGLIGVFTLGLFVVFTSFMRWIALIGAPDGAFNSNQVQVGVWTYYEMSIGIACGSLPFLAPLLGCVTGARRSNPSSGCSRRPEKWKLNTGGGRQTVTIGGGGGGLRDKSSAGPPPKGQDGFTRLYDSPEEGNSVFLELQPTKGESSSREHIADGESGSSPGLDGATSGVVLVPGKVVVRTDLWMNESSKDLESGSSTWMSRS